ncbi:MAG: TIGR03936 family radical SAM-associated protein [Candidatus Nanopelagicales bacterium]
MSRQPDRDVAPPVQRLRLRYARRGRLRFSSHRDFQRAFERALRRADVPMAYSAGFSPHPKVSYANAAPTGTASEAEYLEIGVVRACDPDRLRDDLDRALPPGLDVLDAVVVRTPDLAGRLEASEWRLELPGVPPGRAAEAAQALLAVDEVEVERLTKNGRRRFDARGPVLLLEALEVEADPARAADVAAGSTAGDCAILRLVVRHVTPSVRPDDVLAALRQVADLAPPVPPLVTRLAQGPLAADGRSVGDPLAPDRSGAQPAGSGGAVVGA